jgi:hypothetical protein
MSTIDDGPAFSTDTFIIDTDDGQTFTCTPVATRAENGERWQVRWSILAKNGNRYVGPEYLGESTRAAVRGVIAGWWVVRKALDRIGRSDAP